MATYDMGGFIRQLRHERGVTQEQLCDGLCSLSTLSKIERGLYTPPAYLFRILMERLGNYFGRYYSVFLCKKDFDIWKMMEETNKAIISRDILLAEKLLSDCCAEEDFDQGIGRQFILNCTLSIEVMKEEQSKLSAAESTSEHKSSYDYHKWEEMALESVRITIPRFDVNKISTYMLSYEEIRAIVSLSVSYIYCKKYEQAILALRAIAESMDKFCPEKRERARYYAVVLANLADSLYEMKRYDEAIETCLKGWKFCVDFSRTVELPIFMLFHGKCLIEQGNVQKGIELLRSTYIVAQANRSNAVSENIKAYFKHALQEDIAGSQIYPPL